MDCCADKVKDLLLAAADMCIPIFTVKRRTNPPWINKEILCLIKKKKRLWHQLKAQPSESLSQKFKDLRSKIKKLIRSEYHKYLQHLSDVLKENPKRFWSYHSIKTKSKRLPDISTYNEIIATKPKEQANLFNIHFHSVFCKESLGAPSILVNNIHNDDCANQCTDSVSCTTNEVQKILQQLDASKTSGVDKIPARLLKETAHMSAVPLTMLYNLSFKMGQVPKLWKHANVTPIHKDGDREPVEHYRGISLLTITGKCQERLVYNAIIYEQVIEFVHSSHHGFLRGRSCTTQLLLVHHDWSKALDNGGQVDVVFIDFAKAFDLVNHTILLTKLYKYGVHGSLLEWCRDYLTDRQQRVVVKGEVSDWLTITSGVPQGSLLGPLFFIIYINDLPGIINKNSSIALYADDSKLYRIINSPDDMSSFQGDLDKISDWCKENKMKINTKKCKIMRITRKKSPLVRDYYINEQSLESVHIYKDLGLLTSSNLSWNSHVDSLTAKANKVLGLVKRTCKDFKDITTLRTLYCSLVRPLLEYSCETWNPHTQRNINRIEAIQRRATKFILKSNEDYNIRLKELDLQSLYNRRYIRDVVFLFNLINGHYNVDVSDKLIFCKKRKVDYNLRKNDTLDLVTIYSRTNIFKYSYFIRIVNEWNNLPNDIKESVSISSFKRKVVAF